MEDSTILEPRASAMKHEERVLVEYELINGKLMCQMLPREIRDLAYEYFWAKEDDLRQWLRSWYPVLLLGRTSHAPFKKFCANLVPLEAQVSAELVQWYYENYGEDLGIGQFLEMPSWFPGATRANTRCLLEALDLRDLAKFMHTDVFGVGTIPADCKLRALTVRLDLADDLADYTAQGRIDECLAPVLTQERSDGFKLYVNVVGWWADESFFELISGLGSKLAMAFNKLTEGGVSATARLTLIERNKLKKSRVSIVDDLGDLLGGSEDDWEEFLVDKLRRRP